MQLLQARSRVCEAMHTRGADRASRLGPRSAMTATAEPARPSKAQCVWGALRANSSTPRQARPDQVRTWEVLKGPALQPQVAAGELHAVPALASESAPVSLPQAPALLQHPAWAS